jgi:GNAT superfamily N-acetyltransferase
MVEIKKVRKTFKNHCILRNLDKICFPEDLLPLLGLPKYSWWFAYDENKEVIGYASACKMGDSYFLARVGVSPDKRGQGIQKMLIEKRIEAGKMLGLKQIVTYTSINNNYSIKNLKECVFEEWIDAPKKIKEEGFTLWSFKVE